MQGQLLVQCYKCLYFVDLWPILHPLWKLRQISYFDYWRNCFWYFMNYFEKSPKTYLDFHGFASVEFSHAFDLRKGNIVSIFKSMSDLKMKKKSVKKVKIKKGIKRGYQIENTEIDLGGYSPVFEINSWNFQHMLDLGFSKTSQNFGSFRQLFYS